MKILIACEESQTVCKAFRNRGHLAYSCDLLPTRGNKDWHFTVDALHMIDNNKWDMIVCFPPCTDLAVSGARWFPEKRKNGTQQRSIDFFMRFVNNSCPLIAIENPIGIMSTLYRKPDQIIQPWQFGHKETKATCLWLKGLKKLHYTDIVGPPPDNMSIEDKREWNKVHREPPGPNRARNRSKTFEGIAKAMAIQWG